MNSTVGFSAIHHGKPVKPCGIAFYDMHGLTFQGALDDFWSAAPTFRPDPELYRRFREHVIRHTQLNGNFYRRLEIPGMACGLVWRDPSTATAGMESPPLPAEPSARNSSKI